MHRHEPYMRFRACTRGCNDLDKRLLYLRCTGSAVVSHIDGRSDKSRRDTWVSVLRFSTIRDLRVVGSMGAILERCHARLLRNNLLP